MASPQAWDLVVEMHARGVSLTAISKMPSMPSRRVIWERRQKDAEFAARLGPSAPCKPAYPLQIWEDIFQHLVSGKLLKDICRMPGYPSMATLQDHRTRHPDYHARIRAITIERGYMAKGRAHPGLAASHFPSSKWDSVLLAIGRCGSVHRALQAPDMPHSWSVYRKASRDAGFAEALRHHLSIRRGARSDQVTAVPTRQKAPSQRSIRIKIPIEDLMRQVKALMPKYLSPDDRDDIISAVIVDIYAGVLPLSELTNRIKPYVRSQTADNFRTVSTETPVGENFTLGQSLGF